MARKARAQFKERVMALWGDDSSVGAVAVEELVFHSQELNLDADTQHRRAYKVGFYLGRKACTCSAESFIRWFEVSILGQ